MQLRLASRLILLLALGLLLARGAAQPDDHVDALLDASGDVGADGDSGTHGWSQSRPTSGAAPSASLAPDASAGSRIWIQPAEPCAWNVVNVSWHQTGIHDADDVWLAAFDEHETLCGPAPVKLLAERVPLTRPPPATSSTLDAICPPLQCLLDAPFCTPRIVAAVALEATLVFGEGATGHVTELQFQVDTNRPPVHDADAIARVMALQGEWGDILVAQWSDAKTLQIHHTLFEAGNRVELVMPSPTCTEAISPPATTTGSTLARLGDGVIEFALCAGKQPLSTLRVITRPCDTAPVVLASKPTMKSAPVAEPVLQVTGTIALDGTRGFTVPDAMLHGSEQEWTLSFWIYLLQDLPNEHVALFYKGDGHSQRTPSGWLLAPGHRMTLRASTVTSDDAGAGFMGTTEFGARQWIHVAVTFENRTMAATAGNVTTNLESHPTSTVQYRMASYVNARVDQDLAFHELVHSNDGALMIGKAPGIPGLVALVTAVAIFPQALTVQQIAALYAAKHQTLHTPHVLNAHPATIASSVHNAWYSWRQEHADSLAAAASNAEPAGRLVTAAQAILQSCDGDGEEAAALLQAAAKHGSSQAMVEYAQLLLKPERRLVCDGHAIWQHTGELRRDTRQARELIHAAAIMGDAEAVERLAFLTASGIGSTAPLPTSSMSTYHWSDLMLPARAVLDSQAADARHDVQDVGLGGALWGQDAVAGVALYHLSVAAGGAEAALALGQRYRKGRDVTPDPIAAAFYMQVAAQEAQVQHSTVGKQPLNEMQRLTEDTVDSISVGEQGEDDALIKTVRAQAEDGNVQSMMDMGNLYYWGSHGVARDQHAAFRWYQRAADRGHADGQFAVGNMWRKGEGVAVANATEAKEWFQKAADQNHVRALNGLGISYFTGSGVERNATKAFEYFAKAASYEQDGDSLFNAGYCYQTGTGVPADLAQARKLFEKAADRFRYFDAGYELGLMHLRGIGGPVSMADALHYLEETALLGSWGGVIRQGFELYLHDDYDGAMIDYLRGMELGYETGAANAAYLLDGRYASLGVLVGGAQTVNVSDQYRAARRFYEQSFADGGKDSSLKLGDYYFYGKGGLEPNLDLATAMYVQASAAGSSQAAYNLALMHEFGAPRNALKAEQYYRKALDLSPERAQLPVYASLSRLWVVQFCENVGVPVSLLEAVGLRSSSNATWAYTSGMALDLDARGDTPEQDPISSAFYVLLLPVSAVLVIVGAIVGCASMILWRVRREAQ